MDFFDFIQLKVKVSLLIHPLSARKQYRIRQLTERSEVSDPIGENSTENLFEFNFFRP